MKAEKIKYAFEFVGGNTTVIRRTLPDGTGRFVGYIIREVNKRNGIVVFKSLDNESNEILPAWCYFGKAAVQYENYLMGKDKMEKTLPTPTRKIELKNIRKHKMKKDKGLNR